MIAPLVAGCDRDPPVPASIAGNAERGAGVIAAIDCGVCHAIPGIAGADGNVGPSLAHFAGRSLIGGVVPNTPEVLVRWIRDAPSLAPNTGMPPMPLTEAEATDVAAYLLTLR